jgi:hypothetical protein
VGAHAAAEVQGRDVLEEVRLVEEDRVVVGDHRAVGAAHREVAKKRWWLTTTIFACCALRFTA